MSEIKIHPTAIVGAGAKIGDGVSIGPYSIVGDDVELGAEVELVSHVCIAGFTSLGANSKVFPFASIGHQPQDLKYHGEASCLKIGANCTIRENVTINPGTEGGGMLTTIGDDCLFMANSHVAHDCKVGNNVILANAASLAGHTIIDDFVTIGGLCAVYQFVHVGPHAFIGAHSMVDGDVIPYGMALGNRAKLAGLNLVGLKRRKFSRADIQTLRTAYRMIFSSEGNFRERIVDTAKIYKDNVLVQEVLEFINNAKGRSICLPRNGTNGD